MHLSAARILTNSMGVPYWCHPTSGTTIALTHEAVDGFVEEVVERWVRVGVKSMEELHPREISNLRGFIDVLVAISLGVHLKALYSMQ